MSWIQENKFVTGLIGVTVVIGGGILYLGSSQGSAFDAKMEEYETLKSQYASLAKSTPYPSKENLKEREKGIAQYRQEISDVRAAFATFRPDAFAEITPKAFGDARVKVTSGLHQAFKDAEVALPESATEFGFEKYAKSLPKAAATGKLNYQLGATEWLLTKLAEAKPSALVNISRTILPIEAGKAAAEPTPRKKGKGKKKGANQSAQANPYEIMPMELTFTADEAAVREFLKEMVNAKEYFYAIRALRIRNEKQIAPTQKDANFPASVAAGSTGAAQDLFGGFDGVNDGEVEDAAEGEVSYNPPAKVSEVILKQVLGNEKLHVHVAFDIVFLEPKEPTPADAEAADAK